MIWPGLSDKATPLCYKQGTDIAQHVAPAKAVHRSAVMNNKQNAQPSNYTSRPSQDQGPCRWQDTQQMSRPRRTLRPMFEITARQKPTRRGLGGIVHPRLDDADGRDVPLAPALVLPGRAPAKRVQEGRS